jgi:DNA repair exonuclease SbcCD ATPase subunit
MQLLSCRLQRVRLHDDLSFQFGRQLTLIGGPNESGKSTVVEALHKGLFLRSTATGRGVEELRSRIYGGLPEIEICFAACGQHWTLRKRFAGAGGTCQLSTPAGESLRGSAAEERLAELLGMEGPVEGRRINQLPERWAHLWVRQGESGANPLAGKPESYDYERLIDRLQGQSSSDALQSARDSQVLEQLQQRIAPLFTATGRIKAGSPLAQAIERESDAQRKLEQALQRLQDLEQAMERWRSLSEQLERIEQDQLPALRQELQQQQHLRLQRAELEPLQLQINNLRDRNRQRLELEQKQQQQSQEQAQLQQELEHLDRSLSEQLQLQNTREKSIDAQQQRLKQLRSGQDLAQLLLDLAQLQGEQEQLEAHQQRLQWLQQQAQGLKDALAQMPPITADQVRSLRRAEQALAQANARCDAMAASLEVLEADQPIRANAALLQVGDRQQLTEATELRVGEGVRLRLSPGGGQALPQAKQELQECRRTCQTLVESLGVSDSEAAETIELQRRSHERDLANLRQAAQEIPWSGLKERLEAIAPRRQQLQQRLQEQSEALEHWSQEHPRGDLLQLERAGLEQWQQSLRRDALELERALGLAQREHQQLQQQLQQHRDGLQAKRNRLEQLSGALALLKERLEPMQPVGQDAELELQLESQLQQRLQQLALVEQELEQRLQRRRSAAGGEPAAVDTLLEQTIQRKDQLLSERGQCEQLCSSLGSSNPAAELEQAQADLEQASTERDRLELEGRALLLLQERFHEAQTQLSNRYSEPLRSAMNPYLALLVGEPQQALLNFDPQEGFNKLQLLQQREAYDFDRLSGGMREQMAGALRLAMAEVLQSAYDGVLPLVFDDAFTNTDRDRLTLLQGMLQRGMDQGVQIVLLSCHPEDYRPAWFEPSRASGLEAQKNPPEMLEGIERIEVRLSR